MFLVIISSSRVIHLSLHKWTKLTAALDNNLEDCIEMQEEYRLNTIFRLIYKIAQSEY